MHLRLSLWLALFACATLGAVRAQTPSAGAAPMPPGQIVAKQVTGNVVMTLNGTTAPLHDDDRVSQSATIITQHDSSVILVFSNGATTQLGGDTTLSIEQFLQDPFSQDINVGALATEPTHSRTKLRLTKGELLGKVAHLRIDEGSSFTVDTPVGAAGIRGTTFRIVFRPTGTGQAFAVFSLSTVEGNVHFQQNSATATPPPAPGQPPPGGAQTAPGTAPSSPSGAAAAPAAGVAVTGGQEVVVTVSVNVNAQTGQLAVTAPPVITSTEPISVQTQAALVQQVQTLVTTAASTTFTPPAPSATSGATGTSSGTTSGDKKDTKGDKSSGDSSGSDSSSTSSTSTSSASTTSTSSTPAASTSNPPASNPLAQPAQTGDLGSAAPGVTSTLPNLTPLAGKGSQ